MAASSESDEALAQRAVAKDDVAFETLVARYEGRVYRLARRLSGNVSDAQDILQETFLQVHRRLESFRGEARFSTWLYRIATNAALMFLRQRRRRQAEPLDDYLPRFDALGQHADFARAVPGTDEVLDRKRLAERAMQGIERLPDLYRVSFVLRDLEEMPTAEVAELLGVDSTVVRQRVHRARLMLRGYLSEIVEVKP